MVGCNRLKKIILVQIDRPPTSPAAYVARQASGFDTVIEGGMVCSTSSMTDALMLLFVSLRFQHQI